MKIPTLTPLEAKKRLEAEPELNNCLVIDGITYFMDGPMMSPSSMHAPLAIYQDGNDYYDFYIYGEPGDPMPDDAKWLCMCNFKEVEI